MFNTVLVLIILYLIISGGSKGWYNKRRDNGYGRQNKSFSKGRYSEFGNGNSRSKFDDYNRYEKDYGPRNDNYGSNRNDPFENQSKDPWSKDRSRSSNSFDDW